MFARRIVAKHVTKTTALAMLGATAVLSGLQVLFTYLGELGSLKEGYGALDALWHVLWGAPGYLYEILPIAALIGAVLGLGTLASNSELIVMRAAGISLWRIVGWVVRSALILVVLSFALSEWVIPYTNERAESVKKHRSVAELGEVKGYWTRMPNVRPVVGPGLAGCCTVVSVAGVVCLSVIGWGFAHDWDGEHRYLDSACHL